MPDSVIVFMMIEKVFELFQRNLMAGGDEFLCRVNGNRDILGNQKDFNTVAGRIDQHFINGGFLFQTIQGNLGVLGCKRDALPEFNRCCGVIESY